MTTRPPSSNPSGKQRKRRSKKPHKSPSRFGRLRRWIVVLSILLLCTSTVGTFYWLMGFHRWSGIENHPCVELEWPSQPSHEEAIQIIIKNNIVRSEMLLRMYFYWNKSVPSISQGTHVVPTNISPWQAAQILTRSENRPKIRTTIPEGFNRFDIANRLAKLSIANKDAFLHATEDVDIIHTIPFKPKQTLKSVEGYLFPATYEFQYNSLPNDIIQRLISEFTHRWKSIELDQGNGIVLLAEKFHLDEADVVTLASMVEKEAQVDDERPIIASVFLNRLADPNFVPKRLQSDPTSVYGCLSNPDSIPACRDFSGKPTRAINLDPANSYSTYITEGLPPGPIANPGMASITAVLNPASSRYYYFVAKGKGRHHFSETLQEHNQAVHHSQ